MIQWTIQQPGITSVLVGARNRKQVVENTGAATVPLNPSEMKQIIDWLGELDMISA